MRPEELQGVKFNKLVPIEQVIMNHRVKVEHNGAFFYGCYLSTYDLTLVMVQSIFNAGGAKNAIMVAAREGDDCEEAVIQALESFPQPMLRERRLVVCQ